MKQKTIFIILFIFVAVVFFLGYQGEKQKIKENNLLLQGSGYVFLKPNIIENPEQGFSFKMPLSWYLDYEDNILEMSYTKQEYEDCPSVKKGCTISVQVNDQYLEKEKLIQDIEIALKTDKRPDILIEINQAYEILEVSGFKGVKELLFNNSEIGSLYLISVPVFNKNYAFSGFITKDCEKIFENFIKTIKIN
ncbi:MAG: hypothetical protein PHN37_01975 [Candidatus Pacebacteria bacterium]|nr:hypothetical protein [Candidatus Paceibacterota bacterium]